MKKAAILSDIHSNFFAFSACVDDALAKGAEAFVFLGDYITDFPDARKTLDLLYKLKAEYPCFIIRGNRERYMLEHRNGTLAFARGTRTGSWLFNYEQLTEHDLDFFEALPIYDKVELFGVEFEIAHSGMEDDRFFYEKGDGNIGAVFAQMKSKYLLTGHSHKQYIQTEQGKTIINPGSVGVPRNFGSSAHYAMLCIDNTAVDCSFCQVGYDIFSVIHRQFESGFVDCAECWAIAILYDTITGKEYAMSLLDTVYKIARGREDILNDESVWRNAAEKLGMKFTEKDILKLAEMQ